MSRGTQIRPPLSRAHFRDAHEILKNWRGILELVDDLMEHLGRLRKASDNARRRDSDAVRLRYMLREKRYYECMLEDIYAVVVVSAIGRPDLSVRYRTVLRDALFEQTVDSIERVLRGPADPASRALQAHDRRAAITAVRAYELLEGAEPRRREVLARTVSKLMRDPPTPTNKRGGYLWRACAIVSALLGPDTSTIEKVVRGRRARR